MKQKLAEYGRKEVFHFTDKRNWKFIEQHGGLFPRASITWAYIPGGNQWSLDADDIFGMDKYIHLCFLNDHQMEYRARTDGRIDTLWLAINTKVFDLPKVNYTIGVSNQSGMVLLNADKAKEGIDFDHLYNYYDFRVGDNQKRHNDALKSEILVPRKIPIELIRKL